MSFPAKYPGRCAGCHEPFNEGDRIEFNDEDLIVHEGHGETVPVRVPPTCPRCFIAHAGECF